MNEKRVAAGAFVWFLGVVVLAAHHAVLFAGTPDGLVANMRMRSEHAIEVLPLFDWVYLAVMSLTGAVLVISGIKNEVKH